MLHTVGDTVGTDDVGDAVGDTVGADDDGPTDGDIVGLTVGGQIPRPNSF